MCYSTPLTISHITKLLNQPKGKNTPFLASFHFHIMEQERERENVLEALFSISRNSPYSFHHHHLHHLFILGKENKARERERARERKNSCHWNASLYREFLQILKFRRRRRGKKGPDSRHWDSLVTDSRSSRGTSKKEVYSPSLHFSP